MRTLAAIFLCFLAAAPLAAQVDLKNDPLTPDQQDQVAEAGIDPVARVDLYVKFLNERADTIEGLIKRAKSTARSERLAGELQQFGALLDELGDNLDMYSQRKADLRKSLKGLNDGVKRWQEVLHALPSEPGFELSLKNALMSAGDLADQTKQLTSDQEAYFKAHPNEKGQDRAEPQ
jgi:predicted  nucleic acid-binding Zn-ribbon protein